jgi:hypothetical protein
MFRRLPYTPSASLGSVREDGCKAKSLIIISSVKTFSLIINRTPDTISLGIDEQVDAPGLRRKAKNFAAAVFSGNMGKGATHHKKAKVERTSLCHPAPALEQATPGQARPV